MRQELIGTPYLTQNELKEDEQREIWSRLTTTTPEKFRQASEAEITEVQDRIASESELLIMHNS